MKNLSYFTVTWSICWWKFASKECVANNSFQYRTETYQNNFIGLSFKPLWYGSLKLIEVQNKVQNQYWCLYFCRIKIMMLLINEMRLQKRTEFNSLKTYVRSNSSFFWSSHRNISIAGKYAQVSLSCHVSIHGQRYLFWLPNMQQILKRCFSFLHRWLLFLKQTIIEWIHMTQVDCIYSWDVNSWWYRALPATCRQSSLIKLNGKQISISQQPTKESIRVDLCEIRHVVHATCVKRQQNSLTN